MADPQGLFDILSGAAGAPVDRPKLDAFVANSQAINGLRTAQTSEAMLNAQRSVEEAQARGQLYDHFVASGLKPSDAQVASDLAVGGLGNASQVMDAIHMSQKVQSNYTLGDPTQLGTPAATAAGQVQEGKVAPPVSAVPADYVATPGVPTPPVQVSPSGAAQIGAENALAGLHNVQTAAGGFNPHTAGAVTPEQTAALSRAVNEQRLDPRSINSRNGPILAQLELNNPGMDFNKMHADAQLQANPTFQQKAIGIEQMPTLLANMTNLGKKLEGGTGYSDWRTVGKLQQFMNGEFNDPDYSQYMAVRNDTLMKLANLMRGVGMSDQAHKAEIEAAAPTMSPLALDGWLKGQMQTVTPMVKEYSRVHNLGIGAGNTPGGATLPNGAPSTAASAPTDLAALAAAELARRGITQPGASQ